MSTLNIKPSVERLINYPHLPELVQQLSEHYHSQCVTLDDLKTIGLTLWQFLNIGATLIPSALVIECHTDALLGLPWECLYHPELGFLGKHPDYTLSRRIPVNYKVEAPPAGPLNILLWTAQPEKMTHQSRSLDIEMEQQTVLTALTPFISAGWVRFYAPSEGSFSRFVELLQSEPWTVVILNGHGVVLEQSAFFVFEGEDGSEEFISTGTLAQVFKGSHVQCVVVAACQSAQVLGTKTNLVIPIIQAGVPHVIGMREPLIDRAGSVFVQTLCVALAERKRVDVAVQQARAAMTQLLGPNEVWRDLARSYEPNGNEVAEPSVGQWCLPILLSHDPTQALLNWHFCPQPSLFAPVGSKIALPRVFIGRRRELCLLSKALRIGTIRQLVIHGTGGLGKTALAGQLAITMAQQGYRIFAYQVGGKMGFIPTLAQALELPHINCLETLLKKVAGRWLLWLDNLEQIYNSPNGSLTDSSIQSNLNILHQWKTIDLRILLTSRCTHFDATIYSYNYHLKRPSFNDFSRYLQHLGSPYQFPQTLKIYQALGGNFQGVQLLQSMPFCLDMPDLIKQLAIVRRYLQAYL